jgi:hypothetical protein
MPEIRLAILTDGRTAPRFMLDALRTVDRCDELTVFACTNSRPGRRRPRHALYYALNLLSVRNRLTRSLPVEEGGKRIARVVEFEAEHDGAWQRFPEKIVDELGGFDIILKIGMGLLRVPPPERLRPPILSYHHGDPARFRGRPAGFWEMSERVSVMGQIVQRLSNALDAGEVLAFAETKVRPHSWRATLIEAYRHSPFILNQAIRNAFAGTPLDRPVGGRNYRLPSNMQVLRLIARMAVETVKRLLYGAFGEKRWWVSVAPFDAAVAEGRHFPAPSKWRTLRHATRHSFYADPFFSADPPGLLVEAMGRLSGLGEILLVEAEKTSRISPGGGHYSYPATFEEDGRHYILPETAEMSGPTLYQLQNGAMHRRRTLQLDVEDGVLDPTLHAADGRIYLFGNLLGDGPGSLVLWAADSLDSRFERHPMSPVHVSPLGARMAGNLLRIGDRLIRLGQDLSGRYGDGILAFEIERLSPTDYRERPCGTIRFADRHGPHTLNVAGGEMVFDWFREAISPMAGVRRVMPMLLARRRRSPESAPASQQSGLLPEGADTGFGKAG